MSQHTFNFDADEGRRLSLQSEAILERLQQGPASNSELLLIAQRFGARIHELRKSGHNIRISDRDRATGHVMYELVRYER